MNIQVKQIKSEKLQREYNITVPASAVDEQVSQKLSSIQKTYKMPGFRPGKVPLDLVKKNYGTRIMGEVLESLVQKSSMEAVQKEGVKPALQPDIEITSFDEGKDLEYKMSIEIFPEVPAVDLSKITIEKGSKDVGDKEIEETLERILSEHKHYHEIKKPRAAKNGDKVIIDFTGYVGDAPFEGGKAEGFELILGSNQFIPGFEKQLEGLKPGEDIRVKVTFPKDYHSPDLAGADAEFDVTVHQIHEEHSQDKADDHLAENLGYENLDALKNSIKETLEKDFEQEERNELKKQLFDQLDENCVFQVPEKMVSTEFDAIWKQVEEGKKANPDSEEFKGKSDKELEKEYQEMSERRVRLGILLSDLGGKNKITVTNEDLNQAIMKQATMFPGQEQQVFEYFQKNPAQVDELRGPILEEKVVDFLLSKVTTKEKTPKKSSSSTKKTAGDKKSTSKKAATKKSTATNNKKGEK